MQVSHNNGFENTNEKSINIYQLWMRYFRQYRYLFLGLIILFVGGAWAYLKTTLPTYEITARLLIKDEKKGVADAMNDDRGSIAILNTSKISENEMEIIQSRSILGEVAKNLHLYAPVFQKRKIVEASAYTSSPVIIEAINPDSVKPVKNVYFSFNTTTHKVVIDKKEYGLNEFLSTPYGTLKFLPNKYAIATPNNAQFYFNINQVKNVAVDIQKRLTVGTASKMSSILNMNLKDEVPERGIDVLNEILVAYNTASLNDKNILASNTLSFVEDRLAHIESALDSIEKKKEAYIATKGAVDVSEQGRLFLQNVSSNDQKIGDFNMQLAALNQVEMYVESKQLKGGIVPSSLGITDAVLNGLLENLSNAQLQYEKIRKTTPENNPLAVSLSDQITKMRPEVLENIRNRKQGLEASKQNIMATNASYTAVLGGLPLKERELVDISREQNIRSEIYLLLLKKREETALTFSSNVSDSRIVDKAEVSDAPVAPKKLFVYAGSFVLAILFGLALASIKEAMNRKILFKSEIEEIIQNPVLGDLVAVKKGRRLVNIEQDHTLIAEQFRKLWVALGYLGMDKNRKRLLITSSVSGEGKTFVAGNLALSLANSGKKIIIIDLDLRNPSVAQLYGLEENRVGIANFLKDSLSAADVIVPSNVSENLDVILAGDYLDNPIKLISNGKFEMLLDYLNSVYDYIIIDTPPAGIVSDAHVIANYCDASLYVVRQNVTPKNALEKMEKENRISHLKDTGMVFNGVNVKEFDHYQHNYYIKRKAKA